MFHKKKTGYQPINDPSKQTVDWSKVPTSGSNAFKPNPNYMPPASVKQSCTYSTPCGWCVKWDKKCDKKPYNCEPSVKINPIGDSGVILTSNKPCKSDFDHEWEYSTISTAGYTLRCKQCGEHRNMPFVQPLDSLTSPSVVQEIIDKVIEENKL